MNFRRRVRVVREMKWHESRVKEWREMKASGNLQSWGVDEESCYCGTAMLSCFKILTANWSIKCHNAELGPQMQKRDRIMFVCIRLFEADVQSVIIGRTVSRAGSRNKWTYIPMILKRRHFQVSDKLHGNDETWMWGRLQQKCKSGVIVVHNS